MCSSINDLLTPTSPGLTVIGTADLAMVTIPATGQEEVHQALQEDPSMVPLCQGPTMQLWDIVTTTEGTGVPRRMEHPGGALETVEGREAPGFLNWFQIHF